MYETIDMIRGGSSGNNHETKFHKTLIAMG
jgi:hypothetical protein